MKIYWVSIVTNDREINGVQYPYVYCFQTKSRNEAIAKALTIHIKIQPQSETNLIKVKEAHKQMGGYDHIKAMATACENQYRKIARKEAKM